MVSDLKNSLLHIWLFRLTLVFLVFTTVACLQGVLGMGFLIFDSVLAKDPMAQTGYLTILPALWFSMGAERRLQNVCEELDRGRLVQLPESEVSMAQFSREAISTWHLRGATLVGLVVFVGFTFFYYYGTLQYCLAAPILEQAMPPCSYFPIKILFDTWLSPFVITSVIFGFVTGARLGTLAGSSMLASHISSTQSKLKIVPAHSDRHGGFKNFSDMIDANGLLASVPVVWLAIWILCLTVSDSQNVDTYRQWLIPFTAQLGVGLFFLFLCFIRPAMQFTRTFGALKENLLDNLYKSIEGGSRIDEKYYEKIETVRNLTPFPIGGVFSKLLSLKIMFPFFSAALSVFYLTIEDDKDFLSLIKGIRSFAGGLLGM